MEKRNKITRELAALKGESLPKKRKAEATQTNDEETAEAPAAQGQGNAWTDRENFELYDIHEGYHTYSAKQKAEKLHQKMTNVRESKRLPKKPERDEHEIKAQIRDLKKAGEDLDTLRAKAFPPEEGTPRQKKRAGKKT